MTPQKFKELRLGMRLTQQDLALRLGVERRSIVSYENGESPVKPMVVLAVRAILLDLAAEAVALSNSLGEAA